MLDEGLVVEAVGIAEGEFVEDLVVGESGEEDEFGPNLVFPVGPG